MTVAAADASLAHRVSERLALTGAAPTAAAVTSAVRQEGAVVGGDALLHLVAEVRDELTGFGPLTSLLRDTGVSDILVNGPAEVYVDNGAGLVRVPAEFQDDAAVRRLAQRLAASAGRRLDVASPTVDARLPGGIRMHAVLPPVSPTGTLLCLRVLRRRAFGLDELRDLGTVAAGLDDVLRALVSSRLSFLVTGGTGTGKTTLLATLLSLVSPAERIVLVEDAGELAPDHPHVVRLEARSANIEGAGSIDLRHLVRQALRMRPDRIVVGEVRGGEVVELLAALNTGHDGGAGTVHASTAAAVPARLEALGLAAGLARDALHSQVLAGVHAIVHLGRGADGVRRVREIGWLSRRPDGLATVVTAWSAEPDGRLAEGPGAAALARLCDERG